MSFARRSVTSNSTYLRRQFSPYFSHVLLSHEYRDSESTQTTHPSPSLPRPPPPIASIRRLFAERGSFAFSLPLGLDFSLRRYSSTGSRSDGLDDSEYMKDIDAVFIDEGGENADVVQEVVAPNIAAIGEVATAAADSSIPVAALQHVIDAVHQYSGLNWWAAIAVTTILIRSATLPLMINQLKVTTKLSLLRPELEQLKEKMDKSMDPEVMIQNQEKMKQLFTKHGVTPFSPLKGMLIQGPVFISFYLAITNMVLKVPSFKEGGAFWFIDLTTPDPLYRLPILTALSFLITVELNMQEGMEGNPMAVTMKKFFRVLAFFTVPLTANFPNGIFCYWISSNIFSLMYGAVLKFPPVRRFLNLPQASPQPPSASQPSFPFWHGGKQVAPPQQIEDLDPGTSDSDVSQRIQDLQKSVKARNEKKE